MKKKELKYTIKRLESQIELLNMAFDGMEDNYLELKKAAIALKLAIEIEGKNPRRHKKTMFNHRVEWPYLWERIDGLVRVLKKQS